MRRIKQLLTMRFGAGASTREIARELGVAPSTVREYLGRAAAAGIGWPLAADVTDESLMARLFVNAGVRFVARYYAAPDWAALVRELKRPGVNLMVLWEEYPSGPAGGVCLQPVLPAFPRVRAAVVADHASAARSRA